MPVYTFPSLANSDKYGYKFDSSNWADSGVARQFVYFETYGDASIQHAPDRMVTWELLTDYLYSLASAMLTNDELTERAEYSFNRQPDAATLEFAASVIFKESDKSWDKRRYYSIELQKFGTRAKQHDRRYAEINDWLDGSRASTYRLLCANVSEGFALFQIAESVKEWAESQKKYVPEGENWPKWLGGNHQALHDLRSALRACRYICNAGREMRAARSIVEHYNDAISRIQASANVA